MQFPGVFRLACSCKYLSELIRLVLPFRIHFSQPRVATTGFSFSHRAIAVHYWCVVHHTTRLAPHECFRFVLGLPVLLATMHFLIHGAFHNTAELFKLRNLLSFQRY
jgi:hypothetical protein